VCVSVHYIFSSQFSPKLLIAETSDFSTVFLLACYMMRYIFLRIRCQLPVYLCLSIEHMNTFCCCFLSNCSSKDLNFKHPLCFGMPYDRIHFDTSPVIDIPCDRIYFYIMYMNPISTSCLSVCLSEILAKSLFLHAILFCMLT
jgi:hypothetical protein